MSSFLGESSTLICESPRPMSSFLGESLTLICESPRPMSASLCESTSQITSNESTINVNESSGRMSWEQSTLRKQSKELSTGRCSWNDKMDECLFSYLEENKDKVKNLNNSHSGVKEELWFGASKRVSEKFPYSSMDQCYNRWKNIKRNYKSGILNEEKNPVQYNFVERILGHNHNMSLDERNKRKISDEETRPKMFIIIPENPSQEYRKKRRK
ncbi:hypothetical protein RclHR1_12700007 [Rhizophagus clarus]|nr:hypothetical protein RclHR1_12700007 [Rhizophagus clarus]